MGVDGWGAAWGRAAWCARGRRPAREIATRELRSEWSLSRPALALPPPTGAAARPSGAPHTCGAWCADGSCGASSRSPARPRRPRGGLQSVGGVCVLPGQALLPPTGAAAWPPAPSTPVGRSVLMGGLAPVVRCSVKIAWNFNDCVSRREVCVGGIACECVLIGSRRRPRALHVGAAGELARWFETAIAFAGEKWAFLVRFLGAEVMAVSVVPCWG